MLIEWLKALLQGLAHLAPAGTFFAEYLHVKAMIAVILVCLICGAVGSQVVGNRMAFFSDALAHCAFAGIAVALLVGLVLRVAPNSPFFQWGIPAIMIAFGVAVGTAIAYVRERTSLSNDTVIGVFFAGAIGFGAMLLQALNARAFVNPENFLFGQPLFVHESDVIALFVLALLTTGVLLWLYNRLALTSFNTSLARSRQVSVRLCNYAFIILLGVIVNLCLNTVGALLINALLVVPAATASNLSRNMRQMFWLSMGLSLFAGIAGPVLSAEIGIPNPAGRGFIHFGWSGTIVVLSVLLFMVSMIVGPWVRGRQPT